MPELENSSTAGIALVAIDDEPQNLDLISSALEEIPIEVRTFTDPEEGLAYVLRTRPQLVVLDLMMPKLNGMQVLESIISTDPGIEVFLLTGNYSTDAAVEAIQKGASDYLTKPLDIGKFRARIKAFVDEQTRTARSIEIESEAL